MSFPKIYIVHYKKLVDRKKYLLNRFTELGITNYEFIEDFDRDEIDFNLINNNFSNSYYSIVLKSTQNIVKCINMSHKLIYQKISSSDDNLALILEDDALLCDNFVEKLTEYMQTLPSDLDLGFINNGCNFHISPDRIMPDTYWYSYHGTRTCCAYLISKNCSNKILNTFIPFSFEIDRELCNIIKRIRLKVYWCEPTLVQDGSETIYGSARLPNN